MLLVTARSAGLAPAALTAPAGTMASLLTVISMAALGLGVDFRALTKAGPKASGVVVGSLIVLALLALLLMHGLGLA